MPLIVGKLVCLGELNECYPKLPMRRSVNVVPDGGEKARCGGRRVRRSEGS